MTMLLLAIMLGDVTSNGLFAYDPVPHGAATAAMLLVVGIAEVAVKPGLVTSPSCKMDSTGAHCDPADLWALDRTVVGNSSTAWGRISDAGMFAAVLLPVGAALADHQMHGSTRLWHDAGLDILVGLESIVLATFVNTTLKFAVRRPRPALYSRSGSRIEQYLSFPSGHSAATAAGVTSYVTTFFMRHRTSPWRFAVLGGGALALAATGYGRAADGRHFYSDILAGGALGIGVGLVVPTLLREQIHVQPLVQPTADGSDARYYGLQVAWSMN